MRKTEKYERKDMNEWRKVQSLCLKMYHIDMIHFKYFENTVYKKKRKGKFHISMTFRKAQVL